MTELNDERWAFVVEWFDSSADLVRQLRRLGSMRSLAASLALSVAGSLMVSLALSRARSLSLSLQVRQYQLLYYLMDSTLEMVRNRALPPSLCLFLRRFVNNGRISLALLRPAHSPPFFPFPLSPPLPHAPSSFRADPPPLPPSL